MEKKRIPGWLTQNLAPDWKERSAVVCSFPADRKELGKTDPDNLCPQES